MVDLPKKKVGIIACSGEEIPEGTITRLAALKVLEQLRPEETVTLCLPLFLAGGEGDRAFARFYPTIAIDGCEMRCAARATALYSAKPAASVVIRELVAQNGIVQAEGKRRLDEPGQRAVKVAADWIANRVDELLDKRWNRLTGSFAESELIQIAAQVPEESGQVATCSCGSGIPVQKIHINGQAVTVVGLPLIFQQFQQEGKVSSDVTARQLLEVVKIYNAVPQESEEAYATALLREYSAFCAGKEPDR